MKELKTLLWDFDGVIIESMSVRDDAFRVALRDYPGAQVEALVGYHRQNGGLSRYHKFKYFYEKLRGEEVSAARVDELASVFSEYCLERLMNKDCLIQESIRFIANYHKKIAFHIVSGSAEHELQKICEGLGIRQYFGEVRGSPTPKNDLVKDLVAKYSLDPATTGLVGDSINDFEAAAASNLRFFGFRNETLRGKGVYLESYEDLFSDSSEG